jgi:hypothetical protein
LGCISNGKTPRRNMLKQQLMLETLKNEKPYRMEFPEGTTWGDLYDVLSNMKGFVVNKINEENEASKNKTEEKPPEQVA